jgi:hypothetical protein
MSRIKVSNVEIAKEVCKAIPELNFEKVLNDIDVGRSTREENLYCKKSIIDDYIQGFKTELEMKQH